MVELLIALFLGSLIVMTFYQLLITQNKTHALYDDTAEMQQNLRAVYRPSLTRRDVGRSWQTVLVND